MATQSVADTSGAKSNIFRKIRNITYGSLAQWLERWTGVSVIPDSNLIRVTFHLV